MSAGREDLRGKRVVIAAAAIRRWTGPFALRGIAASIQVVHAAEIPRRAGKCGATRCRRGAGRGGDGHSLPAPMPCGGRRRSRCRPVADLDGAVRALPADLLLPFSACRWISARSRAWGLAL